MGMKHLFDVDAAKTVGIVPAILLDSIAHWCIHNKANGKNFHDGLYWEPCSVAAMETYFPYLTNKTIRDALKKLEDGGYVVECRFMRNRFDQTNWYAVTEDGYSLAEIER